MSGVLRAIEPCDSSLPPLVAVDFIPQIRRRLAPPSYVQVAILVFLYYSARAANLPCAGFPGGRGFLF